jgi:hypothetical protein
MVEGARVDRDAFGPGTIGRVGTYKDVSTVWVDFGDGEAKPLLWSLDFHISKRLLTDRNASIGRAAAPTSGAARRISVAGS